MLRWLIAFILLLPFMEIFVFIQVGGGLGVLRTLLLCVVTAIIGGILVFQQGVDTLIAAQDELRAGRPPVTQALDGLLLAFAGACLILPGFISDTLGFLLLVPALRDGVKRQMIGGRSAPADSPHPRADGTGDVIEGQYERINEQDEK